MCLSKPVGYMYFQRGTEKYKDGKEDKKYAMAWKKEYAPVEDEVTTTRGVGGPTSGPLPTNASTSYYKTNWRYFKGHE